MKISILKSVLFLFLFSSFNSCATYKTVVPSEQKKIIEYVDSLDGKECITIPRIYSGISYSVCVMSNRISLKTDHTDVASLPFDLVADTILLPYTLVRQLSDGSIVLKKERPRIMDGLKDDPAIKAEGKVD